MLAVLAVLVRCWRLHQQLSIYITIAALHDIVCIYTLRYGQVVRAPILKVSLYLWYLLRYVLLLLCRAHVCGVCSGCAFISAYRYRCCTFHTESFLERVATVP